MRAGNITIFLSLTTALLSIIQLLINFLMKCTCRCLLADVQQKKTPSEEKCQIVCLRRENGKKLIDYRQVRSIKGRATCTTTTNQTQPCVLMLFRISSIDG